MTLREFIKQNRADIDSAINRQLGHVPRTASCHCPKSGTDHYHQPDKRNDEERRMWVLNDEGLHAFALSKGVRM